MSDKKSDDKEDYLFSSLYILKNLHSELLFKIPEELEIFVRLDNAISDLENLTETNDK